MSALRGHMAEFGIIVAKGIHHVRTLAETIASAGNERLPRVARGCAEVLLSQIEELTRRIRELERELLDWHRANDASCRLETIPGIGFITATALAATVTDPTQFKSGRQFAAWLGLVPRQNSSGGKERLGHMSKQGTGRYGRCSCSGQPLSSGWGRCMGERRLCPLSQLATPASADPAATHSPPDDSRLPMGDGRVP